MATATQSFSVPSQSTPARSASLLDRPALYWGLAVIYLVLFAIYALRLREYLGDLSLLTADEGMRLQSVRDLLAGQAWFDTHQYRYLPPDGTLMHWSRLLDGALAGAMWLVGLVADPALAEKIVLAAWPLLLFGAYAAIVAGTVNRFFGARAAALAVIVAANLQIFRELFDAGDIDHHGLQVVLIAGMVACFAFSRSKPLWATLAGACAALSLTIGLETLIAVAILGVLFAMSWVFDAREGRSFVAFACGLFSVSLITFVAQTNPSLWLAPTCDALGLPLLALTFGAAMGALVLVGGGRWLPARSPRLLASLAVGGVLAAAMIAIFPACLGGPYAGVPEPFRTMWLEIIPETRPILETAARNPVIAALAIGPMLAAAAAALVGAFRQRGDAGRLMLACAVPLFAALLLSLHQLRAIYVGCAFIPFAAAWALDRLLAAATLSLGRPSRAIALLLVGSLFFEIPWVSAAELSRRFDARPPVARAVERPQMAACFAELRTLRSLPKGIILAPMDLGAHILFLTDHSIISAGYHRNVEGIIAGMQAFRGSEADLRDVAVRDGADYVALCLPWIKAHPGRYGSFTKTMAESTAPVQWLEPVPLQGNALKLWRVNRDAITPRPQS